MEGDKAKKARIKQQSKPEKFEKTTEGMAEMDAAADNLSASIAAIHADIKAFRVDIKTELTAFRDSLVKEELSNFKQEVNQKLNGLVTDLNITAERIYEAEQRVAELEENNAEFKEVLGQSIQIQENHPLMHTLDRWWYSSWNIRRRTWSSVLHGGGKKCTVMEKGFSLTKTIHLRSNRRDGHLHRLGKF